jgi:hypothetical protein
MRRLVLTAAVVASAVALSGCGGNSHRALSTTRAPSSATSTTVVGTSTTGSSPATTQASGTPVVLAGNGVASVSFGLSLPTATRDLDVILGNPVKGPIDMSGNCGIDTAVQWANVTAYFDQGAFVGYGTWAANGEPLPPGNLTTAMGLRLGATTGQAKRAYGSAFGTSDNQGGSWSVSTPQGKLIGNLSAVPGQPGPRPTISSIAAGSVGCPAATP